MNAGERSRTPGKETLLACLLALLTLFAFRGAVTLDFVVFDDEKFILRNPFVLGGITPSGVRWALTSTGMDNWHPVTWLSHMADVQLYGLFPGGHHFTSVLVHTVTAVLLFAWLATATGALWRSFAVAALFSVHPLRVESVAWVAERKDVLAGLFWMATLIAYTRYVRSPSRLGLLAVHGLFLLGLMSKPTVVTLPLVLLLLDFWPLRRPGPPARLVREKVPLFLLAAAGGAVTLYSQKAAGALRGVEQYGLMERSVNAAASYLRYLGKTAWPEGLAVFYPRRPEPPSAVMAAAAAALIAAVTVLALGKRRRHPYLAVGWLWFLAALFPVIGLLQVGDQAMADRYTYLPSVGLAVAAVWSLAELVPPRSWRTTVYAVLAAALLGLLAAATERQVQVWRNGTTLFTHALQVTEGNWLAHLNLGTIRSRAGDSDGAMDHYLEALRTAPGRPQVHYNLGALLAQGGDAAGAEERFRRALELRPGYPEARIGLGSALLAMGRHGEAAEQYREALKLDPGAAEAHNNLGVIAAAGGRLDEATAHFREALRLRPDYGEARGNLQRALRNQEDR